MWEEEEKVEEKSMMADVAFKIECKILPYDHVSELSNAITNLAPWMLENKSIGVHTLHGPDFGNGWVRSEKDQIFLSKRTRLILRIPKTDIDKVRLIEGSTLNVLKNDIKIGISIVKPFLVVKDLICRSVLCDPDQTEENFLLEIKNQLSVHGIHIKKAICGKTKSIILMGKHKFTRSLMIADLSKEHSILLQDLGIGGGRIYGCGILLPHKSIDAVPNFKED
ncbi:MAG: type I-MYXAN CRISPR-associated protein Cas6/Cmx6 [Gammaproteobacteria bacterium]|nr:type I-MYXAN CRISPR-associated protein Cas6/Cmx6 [Gammaproteobacteria bacterium]MBT4655331.1 type I-MYXAN CRISPR-associated protein Cas6/Cmx6 [Gammaproteobacteria bacterium]MBT5117257.1 type I-MYXAN CRISPR-associated protein Cas6/Cmx6 [Gammaproteobacteria bacterium]MBT5762146.1 type I-MYXAN CRISPR-associated protein Cas6/Cmx6 [Gammaproteobacteria bacterium]MBT7323277.1 type I-MYXAN CRISPR-associated protein Cas6/Cmx6 [Gammaproteobacteria bacterium]